MAAHEEESSNDFYGVLGLKKECTTAELRSAYKKLAMKWHPDRCSASGNLKYVEEAKNKFQAIQQAYSVLSDANKRFLYDVGIYDCDDDDDENGMGDFLNEMVVLMSQNKSNENRNESFEEFQQHFEEIFHSDDAEDFGSSSSSSCCSVTPPASFSLQDSCNDTYGISNKGNCAGMSSVTLSVGATGFCMGSEHPKSINEERIQRRATGSRRDGRKQKITSSQGVSSCEYSTVSPWMCCILLVQSTIHYCKLYL